VTKYGFRLAALLVLLALLFSAMACINVTLTQEQPPKTASPQTLAPVTPVVPTIIPKAKPVINSFTLIPAAVNPGQPATLSWSVSGATTVTVDNGLGPVPSTGTMTINPSKTLSFNLTAANEAGSTTANAQILVSSTEPVIADGLPIIHSFTTFPIFLSPGESTTLRWIVSNATEVEIDNGVGLIPLVGFKYVKPTATTNYTLKATNNIGWRTMVRIVYMRQQIYISRISDRLDVLPLDSEIKIPPKHNSAQTVNPTFTMVRKIA
jgi:hypothetical protein